LKIVQYDPKTTVHLQLWDIAGNRTITKDFVCHLNHISLKKLRYDIPGQERFSNMMRVYYKDATAAIVVFDITRYHFNNMF
jgi:GTPase SAR1 family protein